MNSFIGNVDISCKKVGLPQIASVISGVYDSRLSKASTTSGENNDEDDSFPLQQKLVVCTLILLTRSVKTKEVTLGKVCCLLQMISKVELNYVLAFL